MQNLAIHDGIRVAPLPLSQVPEAQKLLYNVYNWKSQPNNPSNVRIEDGRLRDDYETTTIYFGARDVTTHRLVGVTRLISNINQRLEISRYKTNFDIADDALVCEINCHVVIKEWRQTGAIHYLIAHMILTASQEWDAQLVIGAVAADKVETLANRFHGCVVESAVVQYEANDEERRLCAFVDSIQYRKAVLKSLTALDHGIRNKELTELVHGRANDLLCG